MPSGRPHLKFRLTMRRVARGWTPELMREHPDATIDELEQLAAARKRSSTSTAGGAAKRKNGIDVLTND
jgi:hypothetical protein